MQAAPDINLHMNADDVRDRLRDAVTSAGSQTAWARQNGCTVQYVSMVLAGERLPGPLILDALGLEHANGYKAKPRASRCDRLTNH